jgi:Na+-driven multidrug efflux pump
MSAQNIGANRMDRVSIIYKEGLKLAIGVSSIIALLCIVFSDSIIAMFTKDPLVIEYTKSYIYIVMPSLIALSVMFATNGIINGAGKTFTLMVFAFISLIIIRIPLSYIFSEHFGVAGIWMSMGFSCFVSATLSVTYYISKKWQKGSRIVISEA